MVDSTRCWQALRWFRIATAALGLVACGDGETSGSEPGDAFGNGSCTALKAEETVTLDAEVRVLASDSRVSGGAGTLAPAVVPSGGEVYWCDESGSLFVERQDERLVELRHMDAPPRKRESVLGLAANSTHVYVGYAYGGFGDDGTLSYEGPGRLLSISKQDGQATDLLESEQGWFAPISADDERVIVFASRSQEAGFYQVPLDHPQLEALPLGTASAPHDPDSNALLALWDLFEHGQLVGDQVYWRSSYTPPLGLLRSGFDDAQPELLSDSFPTNLSFTAGPGYVLALQRARDSGYHDIGLNFLRTDDSGCRSVQGPRGEVLEDVALDATHAYWIGTPTAGSNAAIGENTLNRVDLETGAVARLNLPGILSDAYRSFVAQDDTRLFLWSDGALLSVRKP